MLKIAKGDNLDISLLFYTVLKSFESDEKSIASSSRLRPSCSSLCLPAAAKHSEIAFSKLCEFKDRVPL